MEFGPDRPGILVRVGTELPGIKPANKEIG